nr:DNA cytosine methyltransferase [Helicobacter pylori]
MFAGIGGFRLALDSLGLKCVFSAENNSHAVAII